MTDFVNDAKGEDYLMSGEDMGMRGGASEHAITQEFLDLASRIEEMIHAEAQRAQLEEKEQQQGY